MIVYFQHISRIYLLLIYDVVNDTQTRFKITNNFEKSFKMEMLPSIVNTIPQMGT